MARLTRGPSFTRWTPEGVAAFAAVLTPLFLLHGRAVAEVTIAVADACFLLWSARRRDWRWLATGWVPLGMAWWFWVILCSAALGTERGALLQALLQLRFPLFVAALEHCALADPAARRWLWRVVAAGAGWIVAQSALQFATGHNLAGYGRGAAGELTGPFEKARAGPPLARMLLPVLVPLAARLLARRRVPAAVAATALLLVGLCAMVLIGQRMPLLLTGLGLLVSGLLLPRLRPAVLVAGLAGAALLASSIVVAPASYQRLVVQFSRQMEDFASSQYGLIYARAVEIARQHPWTGLGFDGFRSGCPEPRYFRPSFDGAQAAGGGAAICAQHPHNLYLEALDSGGLPGLLLFAALSLTWLLRLATGLWRTPDPVRVGLFGSVLIQLWPIASTSAFGSMPMGGWLFLLLGWALAETRHRSDRAAGTPASLTSAGGPTTV